MRLRLIRATRLPEHHTPTTSRTAPTHPVPLAQAVQIVASPEKSRPLFSAADGRRRDGASLHGNSCAVGRAGIEKGWRQPLFPPPCGKRQIKNIRAADTTEKTRLAANLLRLAANLGHSIAVNVGLRRLSPTYRAGKKRTGRRQQDRPAPQLAAGRRHPRIGQGQAQPGGTAYEEAVVSRNRDAATSTNQTRLAASPSRLAANLAAVIGFVFWAQKHTENHG